MRVTILTYGSRGDVQPCLALALALQRAGHIPLLVLPASFRAIADEMEIPAVSLPGDIAQLSMGLNQAGKNPLAIVRVIKEAIEPVALEVARTAWLACQDTDLIVHTFLFTLGAHAFARQRGIPDLSVQFFPMFFTSSSYPHLAFPELPMGPRYHRLSHHIGNGIFTWSQRLMYPRVRKIAENFPPRLPWPFKAYKERSATQLLLAYSPALVPPESDWGAHVKQTGFWFLDSSSSYSPPAELEDFLAVNPQPVCVGFGSTIHPDSPRLQKALLDGLRRAGQSAVILTGWDDWAAAGPGPDRLFLEHAPHDWLFPRCGAIIHHAGAGTTAAALRSGKPSVTLPLASDQPFWARRIHAYGASPAPLNARTLTANQVAVAVSQALENDTIRQRASVLGDIIGSEDGLKNAVELINRFA